MSALVQVGVVAVDNESPWGGLTQLAKAHRANARLEVPSGPYKIVVAVEVGEKANEMVVWLGVDFYFLAITCLLVKDHEIITSAKRCFEDSGVLVELFKDFPEVVTMAITAEWVSLV